MVVAVRAVEKGPDPYTQSEGLAACAHPDPLFQTLKSTRQTTRRNERGAIGGTDFLVTLFKEKNYWAKKVTVDYALDSPPESASLIPTSIPGVSRAAATPRIRILGERVGVGAVACPKTK